MWYIPSMRLAIPPENAATCDSVRTAAEAACSADQCASNVNAIAGNCETAARFETPACLAESTSCESESECLDLHQCVAGAVCPGGLGFDVAVLCPMQVGWDC